MIRMLVILRIEHNLIELSKTSIFCYNKLAIMTVLVFPLPEPA